jgi:uncharacterized membrane protein YheB (UPF0754 family)
MVEKIKTYQCEYCGTQHDNPVARANCELACYQKKVAEEAKAEKEKLKQQRQERYQEIIDEVGKLNNMISAFNKDYSENTYDLILKELLNKCWWAI